MYFPSQGAPLEASTISQTFSRTYLHRVNIFDDDDEKMAASLLVQPLGRQAVMLLSVWYCICSLVERSDNSELYFGKLFRLNALVTLTDE